MQPKFAISLSRPRLILAAHLLTVLLPGLAAAQVDPANPANPVDYVGAMHNRALDVGIEAQREVGVEPSLLLVSGVERVMAQFCTSEPKVDPGPACNSILPYDDRFLRLVQAFNKPEHLLTQVMEGLSNGQRDEMLYLLEELATLPSDTQAGIEQIRALEAEFAESGLSNDELEVLYGASSVARHSLSYWSYQRGLAKASRWNMGPLGHPGDLLGDPLTLEEVIKADVAGFVAGYNGSGGNIAIGAGTAAIASSFAFNEFGVF